MCGYIQRIKIFTEKGSSGLELTQGQLIKNLGLDGDIHAKGGERQISLLFAGNLITGQQEQGLCLSRFKENLKVCFHKSILIQTGTCLGVGEAVLEITGETKHCYEGCPLFNAGNPCSLAGLNLFAKVIKSGIIRVGDGINIIT